MNTGEYAKYANDQYSQWILQAQSAPSWQVLGDALSRILIIFVVVALLMIVFATVYQSLRGREFSDEFAVKCLWSGLLLGMFISALALPTDTVMVLKDNPARLIQREYIPYPVEGPTKILSKIYRIQPAPVQPCDVLLNQPGAQLLTNATISDDHHWLGVWGQKICIAYQDSSVPGFTQVIMKSGHFWVLQGPLTTSQIVVVDGNRHVSSSLQEMGDTHCRLAPTLAPNLDDTSTRQLHSCP